MVRKAFSLIELLVVVAIIAVLAAVALPAYVSYSNRAKVEGLAILVQYWAQKSQQYYVANGIFPSSSQLGFATSDGYTLNPASQIASYVTGGTMGYHCGVSAPVQEVSLSMSIPAGPITLTSLIKPTTSGAFLVLNGVNYYTGITWPTNAETVVNYAPSSFQKIVDTATSPSGSSFIYKWTGTLTGIAPPGASGPVASICSW